MHSMSGDRFALHLRSVPRSARSLLPSELLLGAFWLDGATPLGNLDFASILEGFRRAPTWLPTIISSSPRLFLFRPLRCSDLPSPLYIAMFGATPGFATVPGRPLLRLPARLPNTRLRFGSLCTTRLRDSSRATIATPSGSGIRYPAPRWVACAAPGCMPGYRGGFIQLLGVGGWHTCPLVFSCRAATVPR